MSIIWKFPETLKKYDVSVYRLQRTMLTRSEPISPTTAYRWSKELPEKITVAHLSGVISALREITGKEIQLNDLLEYIPDKNE